MLTTKFFSVLVVCITHGIFAAGDAEVKCLVCQHTIRELAADIVAEDPRKKIEVGSFRIEPDGSQKQSQIQYAASEAHLYELLENLCEKMSDYAQAVHKETGKKAILKLTEQINMLATHELIPTEDLNESLKLHCDTFTEEFEDDIMKAFLKNTAPKVEELQQKLCRDVSGYCEDSGHTEL